MAEEWSLDASINGTTIASGGDFRTTVADKARELGYSNFRVSVNGAEVSPTEAPSLVAPGSAIDVRPYDKAGVS